MRSILFPLLITATLLSGACTPELMNIERAKSVVSVSNVNVSARYGIVPIPFSLKFALPSDVTFTLSITGADTGLVAGTDYSSNVSAPITIPAGQTSGTFYISLLSKGIVSLKSASKIHLKITSSHELISEETFSVNLIATPAASTAPLLSGITQISSAYGHVCAVMSNNTLKCWGNNSHGQLGDGTTQNRNVPTTVTVVSGPVQSVDVGYRFTCAVLVSGALQCWGENNYGQLGDGTTVDKTTTAVTVALGSSASAVTVGVYHTCALLTPSQGMKCWGYNVSGGLGDGSTTMRTSPVNVSGLASGVASIGATTYGTCALLTTGAMRCWGTGAYGTNGDGTTAVRSTPTAVTGLGAGTVSAFTTSQFAVCALMTATGGLKCWGLNNFGQLGDGTTTNRLVPTDVSGLTSGVTSLFPPSSEGFHMCAVTTGNIIKCWGNNSHGQLAEGTFTDNLTPTNVTQFNSSSILTGALGQNLSCFVNTVGNAYCYGVNNLGQFGSGGTSAPAYPIDPIGLDKNVSKISISANHGCLINSSGAIKCWGQNSFGQLGNGSTNYVTSAQNSTDVSLSSKAISIATGNSFSCALLDTGAVQCWGLNSGGQLGDGSTTNRTSPVTSVASGVLTLGVGYAHACVLLNTGGVRCWGNNAYGSIGDGTFVNKTTATNATGLTTGVASLAVGGWHNCVIMNAGTVRCWGYNGEGELADGTLINRTTSVLATGLSGTPASIYSGGGFSCALYASGTVQCWGNNNYGQLGDGTTTVRTTATLAVNVPSNIKYLSSGYYHNCAHLTDGTVSCWGSNQNNELATGSASNPPYSTTPSTVVGLSMGVSELNCSPSTAVCAVVLNNGGAKVWGLASSLNFGVGTDFNTTAGVVAY